MLFNDLEYGVFGLELQKQQKLFSAEEGLLHGNMFPNLYDSYKNYNVLNIIPRNDKESLMLKIYAYDFALNDLSLYLDVHPQDQAMFKLFKDYTNEYESCKKQYESQYGPLSITDVSSMQYVWYKNPWPWETEEGMYV